MFESNRKLVTIWFDSVQVLHKRIRGREGGQGSRLFAYKRGVGGQNLSKSAYVILEQSLIEHQEMNYISVVTP